MGSSDGYSQKENKMEYTIVRTDTADIVIRKIVMNIARNFGEDIVLKNR